MNKMVLVWFLSASAATLWSCSTNKAVEVPSTDGNDTGDTDADADGDTDGDADMETDTDSDSEPATDTDSDVQDSDESGPSLFVDPQAAAEGLPHYYISNTGDDGRSGESPKQAWATVASVPPDAPSAVFFERGGRFTVLAPQAEGFDGPSAFEPAPGSVWSAYGEGARPLLIATPASGHMPAEAVLSPGGDCLVDGLAFSGQAHLGVLAATDGNVIQDCEVDGEIEGSSIQWAFLVLGTDNLMVGNTVHGLHWVNPDTADSGGGGDAVAFAVSGSHNEAAYNSAVDCWSPAQTLGGAEGGCFELFARAPGQVVEDVRLHHNYCERSVGFFEAYSGNFTGIVGDDIRLNHGVVKDSYVAYNVAVDAMWLYLFQTVNTKTDNLIFEHNTVVHSPANDDIPQTAGHGYGLFYTLETQFPEHECTFDTDCDEGLTCYERSSGQPMLCSYLSTPKPEDVTVRDNLFVRLEGSDQATMALPPGPEDAYNNLFSPDAPMNMEVPKEWVAPDAKLTDTFRIGPDSPAVDRGSTDSVRDSWSDYDGNKVPCGDGPDIGAVEYCPL